MVEFAVFIKWRVINVLRFFTPCFSCMKIDIDDMDRVIG